MNLQDLETFKEIKGHRVSIETREGWTLIEHNKLCWWVNHRNIAESLNQSLAAYCYEGPERFKNAAQAYLRAYPEARLIPPPSSPPPYHPI